MHSNKLKNLHPMKRFETSKEPSISWTPLAESLESQGRWQELRSLVPAGASTSARWQAALASACAFSGEIALAQVFLDGLGRRELGNETQSVALLSEAAVLRSRHEWAKARQQCEQAYVFAKKAKHPQLMADAQFGQAVSFSEEGKIFRAIDLFQKIRQSKSGVSIYRLDLAALNEAWCLWDTGQIEYLAGILPSLSPYFRTKIEVYAALLENKKGVIRDWIVHGINVKVPLVDLDQILLVLTEWQSLATAADKVQSIKKTWLYQQLRSRATYSLSSRWSLLVLDQRELLWPDARTVTDWKMQVELGFLCILSKLNERTPSALRLAQKMYQDSLTRSNQCWLLIWNCV